MPILSGDVKLLKSAVMADVPEGGGAPTGTVIADGVSNAIFPDISELDRAGGRVSVMKTFVAVDTADHDTYFGANVIVADPPADPRVSVTLFSTRSTFDTRMDASARIESYLNQGAEWGGYLFENHIAGQRVIQLFQRPGAPIPNVGQTLVLIWNEGQPTQKIQYVRATKLSSVDRLFYDVTSSSDFTASVVTVDISDSLRYDFTGSPAARSFARASGATKTRDTVVSDAGTYVGVVPLTTAAVLGDFTVAASSIFTQLVPSAQTETPITFNQPYSASGLPVPGATGVTYTATHNWSPATNLSLPGGCLPGSLTIVTDGITITDSAGKLVVNGGEIGAIDYANGLLTLASGALNSPKVVTYTPAATVLRTPQSTEVPVTLETRSQSYTGSLFPIPQPGTLSITYMAQGRWYTLSEAGNGVLKGIDASFGAGTFSPDTGAYVVTLGALPDIGSSLILTWNNPAQETIHPSAVLAVSQDITLSPPSSGGVQVGSLSVSWTQAGTAKTATASSAGVLSGDATGTLSVSSGKLVFSPNQLPAVGTILTVDYTAGPKQSDTFSHPSRDGVGKLPVTATLGSIIAGSLEVEWNTLTDLAVFGTYTGAQLAEMNVSFPVDPTQIARDDGVGNIVRNGAVVGTVNYATGAVLFNPDVTIKVPTVSYGSALLASRTRFRLLYQGIGYTDAPSLYPNDESGVVTLRYNSAGATTTESETFTFAPSLKLVPGVDAQVVPGSVLLQTPGMGPWGDNGQGTLREFAPGTGWINRGAINYLTGSVALTSWVTGVANTLTRSSCVTTVGDAIQSQFVFRTSAAPLRPGSLSLQYARSGGGTVNVTADVAGVISGTGISGTVDYSSGVVRVVFGADVTAAGNESEPWYDAGNVEAGLIFKPQPIAMSSLRYNAVAYSYLPLDAELLGIDPVRLPSDGRVPIFRAGGFAVVGHTGEITATVTNAQVIDCARVRLSRVRLVGANGSVINSGYTVDLEAGLVTIVDASGYSQPVTIQHRIEDMAVVRETQISGAISFTRPLTHNYPLGSFVSSAMIAGDLFARTQTVFDQATWNGTWVDSVVGSAATATYNTTTFPITVTNKGALTERWVIQFTNTTAFNVIGEHVGVIATGSTGADCTPINPATMTPYFTILAAGWGAGWAVGNVLRINTIGAEFPVWVVRTVQQGPETVTDDSFTLLIRGDVDTP